MIKNIIFWLWLNTMTIKKYKGYLKKENIQENERCYNVDTHDCDGRCQGCSDCPFAKGVKISKRKMMIYEVKGIENRKAWDKFMVELENDEEWQNEMREIKEKFNRAKSE